MGNIRQTFEAGTLIKKALPKIGVIFLTPTIRSDYGKAALTVKTIRPISRFNMYILDNRGMTGKHLGYNGHSFRVLLALRNILFITCINFDGLCNT